MSEGRSDDFERYVNMGLHIDPNHPNFLYRNGNFSSNYSRDNNLFLKESVLYFLKISSKSRAEGLSQKQKNLPGPEKDYKTYIDCYRRAYENETRPTEQMRFLYRLLDTEAARDFDVGGLRQINHLIQMDPTPNLELKEARSEIYKISISFEPKSKSF